MIWYFTAHTINCVCHSRQSLVFRVFGIYNFACEVHIVVIIWVNVARAVSIKLDFNLIPNLKLVVDQGY